MKPVIIKIEDFQGGMTDNDRQGNSNQFSLGQGLDIRTKKGSLAPGFAWNHVQIGASNNVPTLFSSILATAKDNNIYFGGQDAKIYSGINDPSESRNSGQSGSILGLGEYKSNMYYGQNTTIGKFDFALTYDDTWQSGLDSFTGIQPMHESLDSKFYIGRGRYIAQYNGITFIEKKLDLTLNWTCADISDFGNLYLAVAVNSYLAPCTIL